MGELNFRSYINITNAGLPTLKSIQSDSRLNKTIMYLENNLNQLLGTIVDRL